MQTGNFCQGELTSKRYARGTQRGGCAQTVFIMNVHLSGYMDFHIRHDTGKLDGNTDILHDKGVNAAAISLTSKFQSIGKLRGQHYRVQRKIDLHPAKMRIIAGFRQVFEREIIGTTTGIEVTCAQIHCIGASFYGCVQTFHVASRGQKLHILRARSSHHASFVLLIGFLVHGFVSHTFVLKPLDKARKRPSSSMMAVSLHCYAALR